MRRLDRIRLAGYYRYLVIVEMRTVGHSLREIGGYFWISGERVRQILQRGCIAAQLELPTNTEKVT
jgi:hypothetical protein